MPYHRPISDPKRTSKMPEGVGAIVQAEKMIQIAILLPCSAFIGWLAGAWLDERFHQAWIAFAGILFGGFAGLVYVVRLALATEKQSRQAETGDQAENDKDS